MILCLRGIRFVSKLSRTEGVVPWFSGGALPLTLRHHPACTSGARRRLSLAVAEAPHLGLVRSGQPSQRLLDVMKLRRGQPVQPVGVQLLARLFEGLFEDRRLGAARHE